jgi:hypothetical protein
MHVLQLVCTEPGIGANEEEEEKVATNIMKITDLPLHTALLPSLLASTIELRRGLCDCSKLSSIKR